MTKKKQTKKQELVVRNADDEYDNGFYGFAIANSEYEDGPIVEVFSDSADSIHIPVPCFDELVAWYVAQKKVKK